MTKTTNTKGKHTATPDKAGKCDCKHTYQDGRYGAGNRLHHARGSATGTIWACTVCGREKVPAKNNMSNKPECILDGCNTKQVSRGLCETHLKLARALINSGQKTEGQLIAAGRMMPKQEPVGRPLSAASRLLTECP